MEFDKWLKELDAVAAKNGQEGSLSEQTGKDCWRGYYDDGFSPLDAFIEDCEAA